MVITFGDLFAGGGGVTTGALSIPNVHVSWALNHDKKAIDTHGRNHPETKHFQADITTQDLREVSKVHVLWASIECTQHSKAKGGGNKKIGSYTLGWELLRYIMHCQPYYLVVENVPEFVKWAKTDPEGKPLKGTEGVVFNQWVNTIRNLGYNYEHKFLEAADYGCPTKRKRYFGIFARHGLPINWEDPTHKNNWVACKPFLDLENEGNSIFGRQFNENIKKQYRKPLVPNTLRRLAGGIKKFAPEVFFIMKYYGTGDNCQSISKPLHTVTTKDRHALIKVEKIQFIQDHCHTDNYQTLEVPLRPQLTWQSKHLVTLEKKHFISAQYNSGGKPEANNKSIDEPLAAITTGEKLQFITTYFSGGGRPETQNQSLKRPLNTILTTPNKKALVTTEEFSALDDFDVKMRFLNQEELSTVMGFPEGYFNGLSTKDAVKLIGNAVPVQLATVVLRPVIEDIYSMKTRLKFQLNLI